MTAFADLIAKLVDVQAEADELIDRAESKYGEWINSNPVFPPANISEATDEELMMMLALLQEDNLKTASNSSLDEFRRWTGGEDVVPWSARFALNWLVYRRDYRREYELSQ